MTKTKRLIHFFFIFALIGVGIARWAKVSFQPLYSDVRFQPSDQLHAGCTNSADILFSPQGQKITKFKIILSYNPESLEILRILPTVNSSNATSKIEYDKIILEVTNPTFSSSTETKSFFQIYFKSDVVGKDTITLITWSEASVGDKQYPLAGSFDLVFSKVPECEPDIIPPSINLIYPKDSTERIRLDQYFIFDIKDIGKGIDKNSVIINFYGDQYFSESANIKRNGNYLTFYPSKWIPVDSELDLKIMITDKQSYGWANTSESMYNFTSATGMLLTKDINPMMFRQIAQEAEKLSASIDECALLWDLYITSDFTYQTKLTSIIQKLWCNLASLDTSFLEANPEKASISLEKKQYKNVSVFWTLWWILFFITFSLKIHYMILYKKHKKLHKEKRTPKQ